MHESLYLIGPWIASVALRATPLSGFWLPACKWNIQPSYSHSYWGIKLLIKGWNNLFEIRCSWYHWAAENAANECQLRCHLTFSCNVLPICPIVVILDTCKLLSIHHLAFIWKSSTNMRMCFRKTTSYFCPSLLSTSRLWQIGQFVVGWYFCACTFRQAFPSLSTGSVTVFALLSSRYVSWYLISFKVYFEKNALWWANLNFPACFDMELLIRPVLPWNSHMRGILPGNTTC